MKILFPGISTRKKKPNEAHLSFNRALKGAAVVQKLTRFLSVRERNLK